VKRLGKKNLLKVLIKLGFRKDVCSLAENIYQRTEEACILFTDEDNVIDYDDLQDRISSELRIFKALQKEIESFLKERTAHDQGWSKYSQGIFVSDS